MKTCSKSRFVTCKMRKRKSTLFN